MRSRILRMSGFLIVAAALVTVLGPAANAAPIVVNELNFLSQGWKKAAVDSGQVSILSTVRKPRRLVTAA